VTLETLKYLPVEYDYSKSNGQTNDWCVHASTLLGGKRIVLKISHLHILIVEHMSRKTRKAWQKSYLLSTLSTHHHPVWIHMKC